MFYRILEKAKLRRIRFHDLRHTFASLLSQNSESLAYVRDQLGHKSIQVTVNIYGHLVPGGNRATVDRLDDVQPSATPAHPETVAAGQGRNCTCCGISGEANVRELEPDRGLAAADRSASRRGANLHDARTTSRKLE
jgi:integrase